MATNSDFNRAHHLYAQAHSDYSAAKARYESAAQRLFAYDNGVLAMDAELDGALMPAEVMLAKGELAAAYALYATAKERYDSARKAAQGLATTLAQEYPPRGDMSAETG